MSVHSVSLKGLRPNNEDNHSVKINLNNKDKNLAPVNLYAVYDGHGVNTGGKTVSKYLADNLPRFFTDKRIKYPLKKSYIDKVYDHLQEGLTEKHKIISNNSGSTCLVVAHYKKNSKEYLDVMNTGDSRCVICRDNRGVPLTKDHKPFWPDEMSRITKLGGIPKYDGADWRIGDLSVSRAFGDRDTGKYITHLPEVSRFKIGKDDKFLILACDGLWDAVSSQDAVNFVLHNSYDNEGKILKNKENIAKKLGDHAINAGSTDNVTVMIVYFDR